MDEMHMNPAPILLTQRANPQLKVLIDAVRSGDPTHTFRDRADNGHRLWTLTDPALLEQISAALTDSHLLIADGHHRYSAYLELARRHPGTAYEHGLAMLVDQEDTPLFLGAIHRFLPHVGWHEILDAATTRTAVVTLHPDRDAALADLGGRCLVLTDGAHWASLLLPADT